MLNGLGSAQGIVVWLLSLAAFGAEVFALVDCLRHRPDAFVAAGKRTKQFWTIVTVVATLLGFVSLGSGRIFSIGLIAFVGAAIYLADVRPALQQVRGGRGGQRMGPYGPW
jgi:predicted cobalt transporter CbtA